MTLMVYMCGSDLEANYGSATADLEEMTRACDGNGAVTLLILTGGSPRWIGAEEEAGGLQILEIAVRGRRKIADFPSGMNMGEADTLSAFLRYGVENRPADRYALILWDHGAGPMEGVCFAARQSYKSFLKKKHHIFNRHSLIIALETSQIPTVIPRILRSNYGSYRFAGIAIMEADPSEEKAHQALRALWEDYPEAETIPIVATADTLVQYLTNNWVDEVYLDVPTQKLSGSRMPESSCDVYHSCSA